MDFLVYHKLAEPEMIQCVVNNLEGNFEDVFACGDLITIKDGKEDGTPELIIHCIKDSLKSASLQKEDVIYIFFAGESKQMRLWPLKRAGRSKMHRLDADFTYYQI